ncbi:MAG TPA: UDP-N-acetylmuramoyl-tripeptide--D-alanyl-D-alanine ligase [Blastocatellia bacterium]
MKVGEIADILTGGKKPTDVLPGIAADEPIGYSIDSRSIRSGELFFAIRGENNDGHRFVPNALAGGAIAAVVEQSYTGQNSHELGRLIRVPDTLEALQFLASTILRSWKGKEIAITGSSGKTTTKDITATLLSTAGTTLKSIGNLNNAYGLPLSVLKLESDGKRPWDFDFAVFEMGMNHKGEIARLTEIAPPTIGVVTNVSAVHLEFFNSIDEIAEAKSEMIAGIHPGGTAVLNSDDERVAKMASLRSDVEIATFGIEKAAEVMATDIQPGSIDGTAFTLVTPEGSFPARLPLFGRHNLYNALAGAAVARLCGVTAPALIAGLSRCHNSRMRGDVLEFSEGFSIVDDSYNSNPAALSALVASFKDSPHRKIVVAGEMLELGQMEAALHRVTGRNIAAQDVSLLIGVRGLAKEIVTGAHDAGMASETALFVETPEEAAELVAAHLRPGDLVLIKGSRGVKMEKTVEALKQRFTVAESGPRRDQEAKPANIG